MFFFHTHMGVLFLFVGALAFVRLCLPSSFAHTMPGSSKAGRTILLLISQHAHYSLHTFPTPRLAPSLKLFTFPKWTLSFLVLCLIVSIHYVSPLFWEGRKGRTCLPALPCVDPSLVSNLPNKLFTFHLLPSPFPCLYLCLLFLLSLSLTEQWTGYLHTHTRTHRPHTPPGHGSCGDGRAFTSVCPTFTHTHTLLGLLTFPGCRHFACTQGRRKTLGGDMVTCARPSHFLHFPACMAAFTPPPMVVIDR